MPARSKGSGRAAAESSSGWESYDDFAFSPVAGPKGSIVSPGRVFHNGKLIDASGRSTKSDKNKNAAKRKKVGNSSDLNGSRGSSRGSSSLNRSQGSSKAGSSLNRSQGSSRGASRKRKQGGSGGGSGSSSGSGFSYGLLAKQALLRPKLTSGNIPGLSLKMTMASMAVLQDLHEGIPVIKVSHHGGDWHRRVLTISHDQCALFITHARVDNETHVSQLPTPFWTPSKGWKAHYQRYVDIADISDVQIGVVGTQVLESIKRKTREEIKNSLLVIHHHECLGRRSLNLIVENPSHRMALVGALLTMKQNYRDQQKWVGREILLLRYLWYDVDADQNSLVSEKEFLKVCERINLYVPNAKGAFRDFLRENYGIKATPMGPLPTMGGQITYGECTKLLSVLKGTPLAVDEIWQRLFGSAVSVTPKRFLEKFLRASQGEKKASLQDAKDLIATLNSLELGEGSEPENASKLEKDRFEEFLRSEWNDAYDPRAQMLPTKKGLTKPLSAYWISTSHNTYLTGDQLQSRSSVEAYTTALQRGCKCLELDVWDGFERRRDAEATDPEDTLVPLIHHAHKLTDSSIELEMVLLVVKNYLSQNPEGYPIILAIENHCSPPYQRAIARMTKKIFGLRLFHPSSAQRKNRMPSPEELRGMILLKAKRPPEPDDAIDPDETRPRAQRRDTQEFINGLFDQFQTPATPTPRDSRISTFVPASIRQDVVGGLPEQLPFEDEPLDDYDDDDESDRKGTKRNKGNPSQQLGDATTALEEGGGVAYDKELLEITYFHGAKFRFFEESIEMLPSHMHSINERKIGKLVNQYANNPDLWREFNRGHLTRTYPAGYRVDSSNYNPLLSWAMGCQLVALNFQTVSTSMIMNDGRFRQHGGCGYVEKPESVMNPTVGGDDPYTNPAKQLRRQVKIRILSGSCLPKPFGSRTGEHIDPLVRIELHDVRVTKRGKEQYCTEKHVTKRVDNNGFSPVFEDKGHVFNVHNKDVAMLVFRLLDEDIGFHDQIASAAIPVSCLRKGYRSIQLYNENNTRAGPFQCATLLAQIQMSH